ncbi:MAG TPA: hypothetical protein DD418_13845 [Pseudomonas sp.]|nr:hypothetical protein [Pseudomonas sp.]
MFIACAGLFAGEPAPTGGWRSVGAGLPVLASSRVNPLLRGRCGCCRSGFTRERAGTDKNKIA